MLDRHLAKIGRDRNTRGTVKHWTVDYLHDVLDEKIRAAEYFVFDHACTGTLLGWSLPTPLYKVVDRIRAPACSGQLSFLQPF